MLSVVVAWLKVVELGFLISHISYPLGFVFSYSEKLLSALGVDMDTLPPHIYRMRQLGYPPGWLKEAEMENSGLTLYDGKGKSSPGETITTLLNTCFAVFVESLIFPDS